MSAEIDGITFAGAFTIFFVYSVLPAHGDALFGSKAKDYKTGKDRQVARAIFRQAVAEGIDAAAILLGTNWVGSLTSYLVIATLVLIGIRFLYFGWMIMSMTNTSQNDAWSLTEKASYDVTSSAVFVATYFASDLIIAYAIQQETILTVFIAAGHWLQHPHSRFMRGGLIAAFLFLTLGMKLLPAQIAVSAWAGRFTIFRGFAALMILVGPLLSDEQQVIEVSKDQDDEYHRGENVPLLPKGARKVVDISSANGAAISKKACLREAVTRVGGRPMLYQPTPITIRTQGGPDGNHVSCDVQANQVQADDQPHFEYSSSMKKFISYSIFWELGMIACFAAFTEYSEDSDAAKGNMAIGDTMNAATCANMNNMIHTSGYAFFQDVNVMIFIGFGYLMTFLRKYGYGAVGFTLMVACFCLQWHVIVDGFWANVFNNVEQAWTDYLALDIPNLLLSEFAAGAVLITFGALIGKVTPFQLLCIAMVEVILYSLNNNIGIALGVADIGGSIVIHMFGAYFGLAASLIITTDQARNNNNNNNVYHADLFAMVGTVFLWMFWPSFNGAPAFDDPNRQHRAAVNTLLSLTGSVMASFLASGFLRPEKKFNMVDIQNATLAGGVAMGTSADMLIGGGYAILIGCFAGIVSTVGYIFIGPFLGRVINLHDTCGVHNLHGMPSLIGGLTGVLYSAMATRQQYNEQYDRIWVKALSNNRSSGENALIELVFICITLGMAIAGGLLTGYFMNLPFFQGEDSFDDSEHWKTPTEEIPYYFDHTNGKSVDDIVQQFESRILQLEHRLVASHAKGSSSHSEWNPAASPSGAASE